MISPFNRLPAELLQEIFERCIDWERTHDLFDVVIQPRRWITMAISQVCQQWRSVTLSIPRLWAYIYINNANFIQLCMQRSENRPLYLTTPHFAHRKVSKDAISHMIDHITRWKAVKIVAERCDPDDISGLQGKPTPLLESLHLHGMAFPFERRLSLTDTFFSLLSSSSQARHLRLTDLPLPTFLDINMWSRLTMITLRELQPLTSDDCIKCLSMCTSAIEIVFTSVMVDLPPPSKAHSVTLLPQLSKLELGLRSDAAKFLQYFSVPHLKELTTSRNQGPYDYDALNRFYMQSNFSLETFHFMLSDRGLEDIAGFLKLSWLDHIPNVSLFTHGISERTKSRLLLRPDISRTIKEKLILDGSSLGWGKQ
ncbi:hypothetical protein BDQ17DRAFT_1356865 [Cyathus striatus]|nr:hypothetical protein BDQ17DRAFT_1356865 [Cyathus striatus]